MTRAAHIRFQHHNGKAGKKLLPETVGSGCAFLDFDGDGWLDILFVNSKDWAPQGQKYTAALYRNNRNGTCTDVTAGSGLDVEMFGMGVAIADYDNDGRDDVYITAIDGDRLFHGRFRDVTHQSGIRNTNFGTSAAWFDFDKDGLADLFVGNYAEWSASTEPSCSIDGKKKSYCGPESYKGTSSKLYRNLGNGKFEDVSERAGIVEPNSKALGIVIFDVDNDGWPDVFVANDMRPNRLYRNNRNGTFTEEAMQRGVAYGPNGMARGGMGADAADYDRSGWSIWWSVIFRTKCSVCFKFHNDGHGFVDDAPGTVIGSASLLSSTFGVVFFDYDLDGWPDIFAVNGNVDEDVGKIRPGVTYSESPLLFRNLGARRFEDVTEAVGSELRRPIVGRGAAYGDFDRDGDLDLLVTTNDGPAYLYRNDGGNRNRWLQVKLVGTRSNRSALGAVVEIESASGKQSQTVHSGSSYCSQSDLALTFGFGEDTLVTRIDIHWPSGATQRLSDIAFNQFLTIQEDRGIVSRRKK